CARPSTRSLSEPAGTSRKKEEPPSGGFFIDSFSGKTEWQSNSSRGFDMANLEQWLYNRR
ncbi:hypothetical protein, partial [Mitsuokella jalaludinii]|uniref:hypothetical protein n=1 Tax=Mitsuokella jalaludinii TaxID=187979 RepID=UPI00307C662F